MADEFYTTKITLEVTVKHQFSQRDAQSIVRNALSIPAIPAFRFISAETNVALHQPPLDHFLPIDLEANWDTLPAK